VSRPRLILDHSMALMLPWDMRNPRTPFILVLVLPALAAFLQKRPPWFWAITGLFFYVITLGPYLRTGVLSEKLDDFVRSGQNYVALPYCLFFKYLPLFSRLNFPYRAEAMLDLCIVTIFGHAITSFFRAKGLNEVGRTALFFVLLMVWITEIHMRQLVPFPLVKFSLKDDVPSFYFRIAAEKGGNIIDVPFTRSNCAILYQPIHQKKLFGGMAEGAAFLYPPGFRKLLAENTFAQALFALNEDRRTPMDFAPEDLEWFLKHDYRYLILHKEFMYLLVGSRRATSGQPVTAAEMTERMKLNIEGTFGKPIFEDAKIVVYEIKMPGKRAPNRSP